MDKKRVLFIGNSHTYVNDMANMFKNICRADENVSDVFVTMLASGGKTLDWHAEQPETPFNILCGDYDYIVLQQAAHPFGGKEELFAGADRLNEWISKTNAQIVAYMTWAEKRFPENQERMSEAYEELAERLHCILAPVGRIWQKILENEKQIELYADDGEHASKNGSFLAALTIYRAIFGKDCGGDFEAVAQNGGIPDGVCIKDARTIYNYCFKQQ